MFLKTLSDGALLYAEQRSDGIVGILVGYPDCPKCEGQGRIKHHNSFYGDDYWLPCHVCHARYARDYWRQLVTAWSYSVNAYCRKLPERIAREGRVYTRWRSGRLDEAKMEKIRCEAKCRAEATWAALRETMGQVLDPLELDLDLVRKALEEGDHVAEYTD